MPVKLKNIEEPWVRAYRSIRYRCLTKSHKYCQMGIKPLITKEELKVLWFRDEAYNLIMPSIDRKNSSLHYTFDNCRFIELKENQSQGTISRWHKFHEAKKINPNIKSKTGRIKGVSKYKDIPCAYCNNLFRPEKPTNQCCSKSCALKNTRKNKYWHRYNKEIIEVRK